MCGRYADDKVADQLGARFGIRGPIPRWAPSWNVAPSQQAPVVRVHPHTGQRHLDLLQWGLIPHWATEPGVRPINARAETVATSKMFRSAFRSRRCLVPVSAYYEWDQSAKPRQPYAFVRTDGDVLALAGLWESWEHNGTIVRTYCIIVTEANDLMRPIHNRMPVSIEPADWDAWLSGPPEVAAQLLRPTPEGILQCWPVSRDVNRPANNGLGLLEPFAK